MDTRGRRVTAVSEEILGLSKNDIRQSHAPTCVTWPEFTSHILHHSRCKSLQSVYSLLRAIVRKGSDSKTMDS
ncbi:hypothetical protein D9757_000495 [Collybiopsis confluens]|uniref:Uncharacterized protein n=1 Tax=Collybiopsis confluens TaxID=2823264 RepID=A0A8H5I1E9_9AGAR|nr:hypothetical protein D9757_000495 [Collybiopsis confluens]